MLVDIRSFEIRVDDGRYADVELFVSVLNDRNGVVRGTRAFSASIPVIGEGAGALVAALDGAFQTVASDIVDWSIRLM